ncbi:hypothetical protein NL676_037796 [Syzygium grande]|nr:hypothetical protein NL676_037796 [Syzygium grande]
MVATQLLGEKTMVVLSAAAAAAAALERKKEKLVVVSLVAWEIREIRMHELSMATANSGDKPHDTGLTNGRG